MLPAHYVHLKQVEQMPCRACLLQAPSISLASCTSPWCSSNPGIAVPNIIRCTCSRTSSCIANPHMEPPHALCIPCVLQPERPNWGVHPDARAVCIPCPWLAAHTCKHSRVRAVNPWGTCFSSSSQSCSECSGQQERRKGRQNARAGQENWTFQHVRPLLAVI
jgi:hypothetical protein